MKQLPLKQQSLHILEQNIKPIWVVRRRRHSELRLKAESVLVFGVDDEGAGTYFVRDTESAKHGIAECGPPKL